MRRKDKRLDAKPVKKAKRADGGKGSRIFRDEDASPEEKEKKLRSDPKSDSAMDAKGSNGDGGSSGAYIPGGKSAENAPADGSDADSAEDSGASSREPSGRNVSAFRSESEVDRIFGGGVATYGEAKSAVLGSGEDLSIDEDGEGGEDDESDRGGGKKKSRRRWSILSFLARLFGRSRDEEEQEDENGNEKDGASRDPDESGGDDRDSSNEESDDAKSGSGKLPDGGAAPATVFGGDVPSYRSHGEVERVFGESDAASYGDAGSRLAEVRDDRPRAVTGSAEGDSRKSPDGKKKEGGSKKRKRAPKSGNERSSGSGVDGIFGGTGVAGYGAASSGRAPLSAEEVGSGSSGSKKGASGGKKRRSDRGAESRDGGSAGIVSSGNVLGDSDYISEEGSERRDSEAGTGAGPGSALFGAATGRPESRELPDDGLRTVSTDSASGSDGEDAEGSPVLERVEDVKPVDAGGNRGRGEAESFGEAGSSRAPLEEESGVVRDSDDSRSVAPEAEAEDEEAARSDASTPTSRDGKRDANMTQESEGLDDMTDANENKQTPDREYETGDERLDGDSVVERQPEEAAAGDAAPEEFESSDERPADVGEGAHSEQEPEGAPEYDEYRDRGGHDGEPPVERGGYDDEPPKKGGSVAGWLVPIALLALLGGGYYYYDQFYKPARAGGATSTASLDSGSRAGSGADAGAFGRTSDSAKTDSDDELGDGAGLSSGTEDRDRVRIPVGHLSSGESSSRVAPIGSDPDAGDDFDAYSDDGRTTPIGASVAPGDDDAESAPKPSWGRDGGEALMGERLVNGNLVAQIQPGAINVAQPELGKLDAEINSNKERIELLSKRLRDLKSNNMEWLVTEVEATLNIVSQQFMLNGNAQSAVNTLENLERRLNRFDSPHLIALKKAISEDLTNLKKRDVVDVVGVALRLERLRSTLDTLPLVMDSALKVEKTQPRPADQQQQNGFINGVYSDVKQSLKGLVKIRKLDNQDAMLLSPDQAFFIRQNLKLRLLDARIALLQKHNELYLDDLHTAQAEVNRYFDVKSPGVASWLQEVDSLMKIRFESPDLNSLSNSLTAVDDLKDRFDIGDDNTLSVMKDSIVDAGKDEEERDRIGPSGNLEIPIGPGTGGGSLDRPAKAEAAPEARAAETGAEPPVEGEMTASEEAAADSEAVKEDASGEAPASGNGEETPAPAATDESGEAAPGSDADAADGTKEGGE